MKKDHVSVQLEAIGEAIKSILNKRQQFDCMHKMNSILYVTDGGFPGQQFPKPK